MLLKVAFLWIHGIRFIFPKKYLLWKKHVSIAKDHNDVSLFLCILYQWENVPLSLWMSNSIDCKCSQLRPLCLLYQPIKLAVPISIRVALEANFWCPRCPRRPCPLARLMQRQPRSLSAAFTPIYTPARMNTVEYSNEPKQCWMFPRPRHPLALVFLEWHFRCWKRGQSYRHTDTQRDKLELYIYI